MLSVALFWGGLSLYTRHTDRMRKPDVSPLVSVRDGIQVVAMLPRHEKARIEWDILQDDEVYRRQIQELINLTVRVVSRGIIYAPAVILAGVGACLGISAGRCPVVHRSAGDTGHRPCASDRFCPALRSADFRHIGSDC